MGQMRFKHADCDGILFKRSLHRRLGRPQGISHGLLQFLKVTTLGCCQGDWLRSWAKVISYLLLFIRQFTKVMQNSWCIQVHNIDVRPAFGSLLKAAQTKLISILIKSQNDVHNEKCSQEMVEVEQFRSNDINHKTEPVFMYTMYTQNVNAFFITVL